MVIYGVDFCLEICFVLWGMIGCCMCLRLVVFYASFHFLLKYTLHITQAFFYFIDEPFNGRSSMYLSRGR